MNQNFINYEPFTFTDFKYKLQLLVVIKLLWKMILIRSFFMFADMKSYPKCLLQSEVSILNPKKCNEVYYDKNYKVKTMICAAVS